MEAVVKQARTTRHPSLVACDANMNPVEKSLWLKEQRMFMNAPEDGTSAFRSTGPHGELIERTDVWKWLKISNQDRTRRWRDF